MKISTGVIAVALVMLAAACGSSAPSGGNTPGSTTSGTQAPAAQASTPSTTPAPDLKAELLAAGDLPSGFSAVSNSDNGEPQCLDNVRSQLNASSKAQATFANASKGPVLEESLAYVPGRGQSDMTAISRLLSGCGPISMTQSGQTLSGSVGALAFPDVADQSSAYQMNLTATVSGQSLTVVIDIVAFRKADTVAMILYAIPGPQDIQALEHIVKTAAAKLR